MAQRNKSGLTNGQQTFCDALLTDPKHCGKAAYKAGHPNCSERTAEVEASKYLRKPEVQSYLDSCKQERSQRTGVDADWLLRRLAEESEADIGTIYNDAGGFLPINEWPLIFRQGLVAGVNYHPDGVIKSVRFADRTRIIELIGRHIAVSAFEQSNLVPTEINLVINRPDGNKPDPAAG